MVEQQAGRNLGVDKLAELPAIVEYYRREK